MARSFVLWLHGLGDSGPANEPIKTLFTSPQFRNTKWSFPSAPHAPVTCNYGSIMPSWFDIQEIPVTADSPTDESSLLKAVQNVHATIDREIAAGTNPNNVFICGFSQGGALTLASVLLYPKTLGGGAVFSGWVPFNSSIIEKITPEAKQVLIIFRNIIILCASSISSYVSLFVKLSLSSTLSIFSNCLCIKCLCRNICYMPPQKYTNPIEKPIYCL
ncbi:hypothetical protein RYX36_028090 [Vicia faba]